MGSDDQHGHRATGENEAPSGRHQPAPAPPVTGPAPQVLPRIGAGVQRDPGGWIGCLDRCCARHRLGPGRIVAGPITQGAQLLDRQDLVGIGVIHKHR